MSELETLPYALVPFMALIIDAVIGDPPIGLASGSSHRETDLHMGK